MGIAYNYERGKSRIELSDNTMDVCIKMGEGNPGALFVLVQMLKEGEKIDPDGFCGELGAILFMDTLRIYGSRIWMLYNDVCNQDLVKTLAILRAVQMGQLSKGDMYQAINNYGKGVDVELILSQVKEKLPNFDNKEK